MEAIKKFFAQIFQALKSFESEANKPMTQDEAEWHIRQMEEEKFFLPF